MVLKKENNTSSRKIRQFLLALTHPGDMAVAPHQTHSSDPLGKAGTAPCGNWARGSQGDMALGSWSPGGRSDPLGTELLRGHRWVWGSGHRWHSRTCSQDTPLDLKQVKNPLESIPAQSRVQERGCCAAHPGLHCPEGALCPEPLQKCPPGQGWHSCSLLLPSWPDQVPGGHCSGTGAREGDRGWLLYWGVPQGPNPFGSRETLSASSTAPGTIGCAGTTLPTPAVPATREPLINSLKPAVRK